MKKDPYKILGIARCADQRQIKSAYRRAAKENHPDLTSPKQPESRFCEIQEAYETLKDEQRRRKCDEVLDRMQTATRAGNRGLNRTSVPPGPAGRLAAEPLIPSVHGREMHRLEPSRLALEIVLSPAEASAGGRFPLRIEMEADCPGCGNAAPRVFFCNQCGGTGRVRQPVTVIVTLPAGIRDGARSRARVDIRGRRPGVLDLLFRIDPWAS
jgi:DnaJ-class molecular chaperone